MQVTTLTISTPTGNYYQFELELGEKENIVKIGLDGKII